MGKTITSSTQQSYSTYRPRGSVHHRPRRKHKIFVAFVLIALLAAGSAFLMDHTFSPTTKYSSSGATKQQPIAAPKPVIAVNYCEGNTQAKKVVVVISKQQLWACQDSTSVYTSFVITGYTQNPADITPTGTYSIFTKERNVNLKGTDGVTSWNVPVSYWMPFLFNKYGAYGLHDYTLVPTNLYGKVNINTDYKDSSHGCVELPLSAAAWIYNWVQIGTPVVIES